MYQAHAIQSIQIVLMLINEQGVKQCSGIHEGFVIREKYDIMKGYRNGHYSMITTINHKKTNKPHSNPHKILPLLSNLTQNFT